MGIVFTRAWEDDRLDVEALAVAPGERVLVVAGAGDAALALAASGAHVTAVDVNPDQLRLVALKIAAARVLPVERLHAWFEAGHDRAAADIYRTRVRPQLARADVDWWDGHISLIVDGFHEHAGVGRAFSRVGRLARLLVPGMASTLEAMTDPAEQWAFWRSRVRPRLFGPITHFVAAHTPILAPLAPNRHELARMRASGWSRGLVARIDAVVATTLVRDHPWWRPAFSGRPADLGAGAAWLDSRRVAGLRECAETLRIVRGDLTSVLERTEPGSLAAISVSNVPDWLARDAEQALAVSVCRALAPDGRVLVRRVAAAPPAEDGFALAGLVRDRASSDLPARERTALYERVDLYRRP